MGIEFPAQQIEEDLPFERKKALVSTLLETMMQSIAREIQVLNLPPEEFVHLTLGLRALDRVRSRLLGLLPEKKAELRGIFDSLFVQAKTEGQDVDLFAKIAAERLSDFIATNYTAAQIEEMARRKQIEEGRMLNRLIEYAIKDDEIELHLPLTFIENPLELRDLFTDALQKLAKKIAQDPDLSHIKKITAQSWIVVKTQRALRQAGFAIVDIDKAQNLGTIEMSREKLIELYGEKEAV